MLRRTGTLQNLFGSSPTGAEDPTSPTSAKVQSESSQNDASGNPEQTADVDPTSPQNKPFARKVKRSGTLQKLFGSSADSSPTNADADQSKCPQNDGTPDQVKKREGLRNELSHLEALCQDQIDDHPHFSAQVMRFREEHAELYEEVFKLQEELKLVEQSHTDKDLTSRSYLWVQNSEERHMELREVHLAQLQRCAELEVDVAKARCASLSEESRLAAIHSELAGTCTQLRNTNGSLRMEAHSLMEELKDLEMTASGDVSQRFMEKIAHARAEHSELWESCMEYSLELSGANAAYNEEVEEAKHYAEEAECYAREQCSLKKMMLAKRHGKENNAESIARLPPVPGEDLPRILEGSEGRVERRHSIGSCNSLDSAQTSSSSQNAKPSISESTCIGPSASTLSVDPDSPVTVARSSKKFGRSFTEEPSPKSNTRFGRSFTEEASTLEPLDPDDSRHPAKRLASIMMSAIKLKPTGTKRHSLPAEPRTSGPRSTLPGRPEFLQNIWSQTSSQNISDSVSPSSPSGLPLRT